LEYVFLCGVVLMQGLQVFSRKLYSTHAAGGAYAFSMFSVLAAVLFFLAVSGGELNFTPEVLVYSVFFAIAYATALVGIFFAIKTGPLSLSSLFEAFSLIIPTFYGLFFLGDEVGALLVIGLLILGASIFFVNFEKRGEEKRITPIWILYILLAFVGNGMCTVVQKMQQDAFAGAYKSEFMIVALLMVLAVLLVFSLVFERREILPTLRYSVPIGLMCGIGNGAANFFVMMLVTLKMPASVMYPLISAGGIIISYLLSRFLYKEKLSVWQNVGVLLGVLAVVLLNL